MHIAVFGATSKVGKSVVVKLVEQNHTVTVFEDGTNPFVNHPNIKIIQGDIRDASDIARTLEGADAVISAISALNNTSGPSIAPTMRTILSDMEQKGIWRIIVQGNVVAHVNGDNPSWVGRGVYRYYKLLMPKALRDSEDQARFLRSSKADWTLIRTPGVIGRAGRSKWKLSLVPPHPWQRVHAEDVAEALVEQLSEKRYLNQAPFISTGK